MSSRWMSSRRWAFMAASFPARRVPKPGPRSSRLSQAVRAGAVEAPLVQGLHLVTSAASDVVAPGQWLSRFEQRLEVAEHPGPSTTGTHVFHPTREQEGQLRGAFEVVDHGQAGHPAAAWLDLVGEAGDPLSGKLRVHHEVPGQDEAPGRV